MSVLDTLLEPDKKVIDVLEALCHKQQRLTGRTHYFWLKLIGLVWSAIFATQIYPTVTQEEKLIAILSVILSLGMSLFGYNWWEQRSYARLAERLANPLRKNAFALLLRIFLYLDASIIVTFTINEFLSGNVMDGLKHILVFFLFLTLTMLYILPACDPLPPVQGKIGAWIRSLFQKTAAI